MNLLITGARGQLGHKLLEMLECNDSNVVPSDFRRNCNILALGRQEMDVLEEIQITNTFRDFKPDIVLNFAAYTNVDGSEDNQQHAMAVNANGAKNIAVASERVGAKLIHMSTDYVFDGKKRTPYFEADLCKPINQYGYSKFLGEQYVQENCSNAFIFRTGWLYSIHQPNFLKTIIKLAKQKEVIHVVNDQIGSPTNADEMLRHLLNLALTKEYGVYHCTGKVACTWYDFAKSIVELSGLKCSVIPCSSTQFPRCALRPAYSYLENNRLKKTIGDEMSEWHQVLETFMYHNRKSLLE
jgi:dTDP-4-dehydrorhamnose reductase